MHGPNLSFIIITLLLATYPAQSSTFGYPPSNWKEIFIRNETDRPIRVVFIQAAKPRAYSVDNVNINDDKTVKIPPGIWYAAVIETVNGTLLATELKVLHLTPADPNRGIKVEKSNGIYIVSVFPP